MVSFYYKPNGAYTGKNFIYFSFFSFFTFSKVPLPVIYPIIGNHN